MKYDFITPFKVGVDDKIVLPEFIFVIPPEFKLLHIEDRADKEYLKIKHGQYELTYPNGTRSSFQYDSVVRKSMNAAVILAHGIKEDVRVIYLRSCVRPALLHADPPHNGNMWECAAGLIDPGETPQEAAKRECLEELGFDMPLEAFKELGASSFVTPGICGERLFYFEVEVDPKTQQIPKLDGSPLERDGVVQATPLTIINFMLKCNLIPDSKTEVSIRRYLEKA